MRRNVQRASRPPIAFCEFAGKAFERVCRVHLFTFARIQEAKSECSCTLRSDCSRALSVEACITFALALLASLYSELLVSSAF